MLRLEAPWSVSRHLEIRVKRVYAVDVHLPRHPDKARNFALQRGQAFIGYIDLESAEERTYVLRRDSQALHSYLQFTFFLFLLFFAPRFVGASHVFRRSSSSPPRQGSEFCFAKGIGF